METQRERSILVRLMLLAVASGVFAGTSEVTAEETQPSDVLSIEMADGSFIVRGLARQTLASLDAAEWPRARWQEAFIVHALPADDAEAADLPPMLGSYTVAEDALRFQPRYPLRAGLTYRVRLRPDRLPLGSGDELVREFKLAEQPAVNAPPTEVIAVFPTADVLPENQLKFYIHFSAPMRRAMSYAHLRLRTESGTVVEYPFLELPEELWDPERTRFTLFFDPGRIKRGLKPREQFGPALEEGQRYVLEIDAHWLDAHGRPLRETYRKSFAVVAPDDTQPDPERWQIRAPRSSDKPLLVQFDEPLDRGMLERVLHVENAEGQRIAGAITIAEEERNWSFRPAEPWRPGRYALVVATNLEDRAGNSIARPFEVDLFERVEQRIENPTVRLSFEVKGAD